MGVPGRSKTRPEEQIAPAPGAEEGGDRAVRRFLYRDITDLSGHARFVIEQSLEHGIGSIAILARQWAELDRLRFLLERDGVPVLPHRPDLHRPIHRLLPVSRPVHRPWHSAGMGEGGA